MLKTKQDGEVTFQAVVCDFCPFCGHYKSLGAFSIWDTSTTSCRLFTWPQVEASTFGDLGAVTQSSSRVSANMIQMIIPWFNFTISRVWLLPPYRKYFFTLFI